ncbi:GDP-mannose 4,6-dehydratase [Pediococcus parvulus]|uniref:GDP-mannose 4,6-dehydratase n=1 Tax=Pediococcus parvulus TaxID=54062 RepID=UPI00345EED44
MVSIKNSRILITGGAGFIGSNLADHLIENNEIVVVDDLSMGKIENLPKSTQLHFFKHSITDTNFMSKLLVKWNFDYIFLLAAVASVADTISRPCETHKINQDANINVMEMVRVNKLPVKKILFSSSAAVYGNNPELPKCESSAIDPISPYAIDKFASERFVIDYGKLYHIPTVATRFFNVYGPKQNPKSPYSGVLSLISHSLMNDSIFTIFGDGKQTRDFTYISDVVSALELLSENPIANHEVYNVATEIPTSLNKVLKIFEKISGKKITLAYKNERKGDIRDSYADVSKIKQLGFSPRYSITYGLKKYWDMLNSKRQKG